MIYAADEFSGISRKLDVGVEILREINQGTGDGQIGIKGELTGIREEYYRKSSRGKTRCWKS